jgi:hypothetical protein
MQPGSPGEPADIEQKVLSSSTWPQDIFFEYLIPRREVKKVKPRFVKPEMVRLGTQQNVVIIAAAVVCNSADTKLMGVSLNKAAPDCPYVQAE